MSEDENFSQTDYQSPPQNTDSAPFSVLVGLFEKLQAERKPDKRRKLLDGWFNVCFQYVVIFVDNSDPVQ
jgi:DNA ligase-4